MLIYINKIISFTLKVISISNIYNKNTIKKLKQIKRLGASLFIKLKRLGKYLYLDYKIK